MAELTTLDLVSHLRTRSLPPVTQQLDKLDFAQRYEHVLGWPVPPYQLCLIPDLLPDGPPELLILAPPGHAKTTLICFFIADTLGQDPNKRFIIASHHEGYSSLLAAFVENILASPGFKQLYGNLVPPPGNTTWNETEKFLIRSNWRLKDPSILAIGGHKSGTIGHRADILIGDDLVTLANSETPTQRAHLANWYFGSLIQRLDPPRPRKIIIGARFYAQDLYGTLKKLYTVREFKAMPEDPVWPELYPSEFLAKEKQEHYVTYMAQYEQTPVDLEAGFLRESDLHYYLEAPPNLRIYQGIDPTTKDKSTAKKPVRPNFFALTTAGVDQNGIAYLLEFIQQIASHAQQKETIKLQGLRWNPLLINFEADAGQKLFFDELVEDKEVHLPLNEINAEGIPKALRLASMATHFRNKKVLLPGMINSDGSIGPAPAANVFVEAWRGYPYAPDDILDSTERCLRAAFNLGVLPAAVTAIEFEPHSRALRQELFRRQLAAPIFHTSNYYQHEETL